MKLQAVWLIFFLLCFQGICLSQATATFTASVTIIEPLRITTLTDMDFAEVDAAGGGVVTLDAQDQRSGQGAVKLKGSRQGLAASFLVQGQAGLALNVRLPEGQVFLWNEKERIVLRDFTSSWMDGFQLKEGENVLRVGASLDISANQKPGRYTTAEPLEVTIDYN